MLTSTAAFLCLAVGQTFAQNEKPYALSDDLQIKLKQYKVNTIDVSKDSTGVTTALEVSALKKDNQKYVQMGFFDLNGNYILEENEAFGFKLTQYMGKTIREYDLSKNEGYWDQAVSDFVKMPTRLMRTETTLGYAQDPFKLL